MRSRPERSRGTRHEERAMNGWQKLEVISKILAALLIPLAVAYLAN